MFRIPSLAVLLLLASAQQQPAFKAGTELVAVEVTAIDNKNAPVVGLGPGDFEVTISGHPRRVVKAEWLTYGTERTGSPGAAATAPTGAAATPAPDAAAAQYIVAIDEGSFQPAAVMAAKAAAERFIDKLRPDDYVGVYAYPTGKANMALSQDHAAVKKVLAGVNAVRHEPISQFHLTVGEIVDIANGDKEVLGTVVERECGNGVPDCPKQIVTEANGLANYLEMEVTRSVEGLRGLIKGLARVPGRKFSCWSAVACIRRIASSAATSAPARPSIR